MKIQISNKKQNLSRPIPDYSGFFREMKFRLLLSGKKSFLLLAFFFFLLAATRSQVNLVPNSDFSQYDSCPNSVSQLNFIKYWFSPTIASPDYFNACDTTNIASVPQNLLGFQNAKTGAAYAGFYAYFFDWAAIDPYVWREYISVKLIDTLNANVKYFCSFYLSLADSSDLATDDIQLYFSKDSIHSDTTFSNLLYIPQIQNSQGNVILDKNNWIHITLEYLAQGGEQYVTIGNFKDDSNPDTVFVGGSNSKVTLGISSAYYYISDYCISNDSSTCGGFTFVDEYTFDNSLAIYPNPTRDKIFISTRNLQIENIEIYNFIGELVREINNPIDNIDLSDYAKGLYALRITTNKKTLTKKFLLIN